MTLLKINAQDRRWFARWLRGNLICVFVAGCLLLLLHVELTVPVVRMKQAHAGPSVTPQVGVSVLPKGWRRTSNGWEHVSHWRNPASLPLGELVVSQRQREPVLIQKILRSLREVPPLAFAMLQLTAIAAIVWVAEEQKKTRSEISGRVSKQ